MTERNFGSAEHVRSRTNSVWPVADLQGDCDPRFERISELLSASIDAGTDLGASVAVTVEGESVVDLWGGWIDEERTSPWQSDTIVNVWSTTKTMLALCALVCVERGAVDLDAPVATYWPEFAANGKERVLVRHLLSHTSGVAGWDQPVELADVYDWKVATAKLAAQAPWWEPGTMSGYHSLNQGHLVGEVVRRATGTPLGRFFEEEIAGPLDADFHIGLDPEHDERVAPIVPFAPNDVDPSSLDPDDIKTKVDLGPRRGPEMANTVAWRRADIGAANGHGNARSVARIQAVVANGGTLDGVELLSPPTIDRIFDEQSNGWDPVLQEKQRFGIGYALLPLKSDGRPERRVCFWGGWGGSKIVLDLDHRMTVSYVMNKMQHGYLGDVRGDSIVKAALRAVRS